MRKLRLHLLLFLPLISLLELPLVAPEPGLCGLPALRSLPGGGRREQIRRAPWGGGMPQGPQPGGMGTAPVAEGSHPHSAPCQGSGCPPKGTKGWVRPAPPALLATPCQISALGPQNLKSCSWNWPVIRRASPHGKVEFSWGQEHNLLIFLCLFRSIPSCWAPSGCPATQHDARKDVFRASCGDATKAPHGILGAAAALLTADFLLSIHPSFQHIPPLSCLALLCLSFPILPSSARRGMAHPKYLPCDYKGQGAPRVCREPHHAHATLSLSSHHAHAKLTRGEKQQRIPPVPLSPPQHRLHQDWSISLVVLVSQGRTWNTRESWLCWGRGGRSCRHHL